jgi:hypothetical protein
MPPKLDINTKWDAVGQWKNKDQAIKNLTKAQQISNAVNKVVEQRNS